ncbi:uncharacterized protein SPPG_06042 [Spizellomyces punctatus DAOM BR117]|uniref:MYND-type domain-containing protein n=1 Tax=Spizellomyces punctatus (strain DAOM BR117) TaxID=645134 RepID=A0A0L0HED9_SPIPD|nr:uncharacterized protein SPPG_06042 [Spizellomyces punctatus DAOM BR117]KNC99098.1 hypothetical protein SPPG_06042 [Spizellomyces punctatus DAOM BR117]|eukprot:XP_016607138.1 hypothetical protein SPPG_06042 [Spizellomyces punctatus DAOM BR117]
MTPIPLRHPMPFVPFLENDVYQYNVWQFHKVHVEEHEEAERFEVAVYLWHEGLKLLRNRDPYCVQLFGDALTKWFRVLDPYEPSYVENYDLLTSFVTQQLSEGPATLDAYTSTRQVPVFKPRCSIERARVDIYPKTLDAHWQELEGYGEEDQAAEDSEDDLLDTNEILEQMKKRNQVREALLELRVDEEGGGDGTGWNEMVHDVSVIHYHTEENKSWDDNERTGEVQDTTTSAAGETQPLQRTLDAARETTISKTSDIATNPSISRVSTQPDATVTAANAPTKTSAEIEEDKRRTFAFNAKLVSAFMTTPSTPHPPTRKNQILHVLENLYDCKNIKHPAFRYGSFDFWSGIFHLELDDLDAASEHFHAAVTSDKWLKPNRWLRNTLGIDAVGPVGRYRHKYQYDAELGLAIVAMREGFRQLGCSQNRPSSADWEYQDLQALARLGGDFLNEGIYRLNRFLATAPGHSEYLPTGECWMIALKAAQLEIALEKSDPSDTIIKDLAEKITCHRARLNEAVNMQSCWSPRQTTKTREFRTAMSCLQLVASHSLAQGPNPSQWHPFLHDCSCSNSKCKRIMQISQQHVRVVIHQEGEEIVTRPWNSNLDALIHCPLCGVAKYCSVECMNEHKAGQHRVFCKMVLERRSMVGN